MAQTVPSKDLHRIVTTCIVYAGRRYHLRKRTDEGPFPGRWEVAGGGVEPEDYQHLPKDTPDGWENVLDTVVRREVLEETGMVVGELRYMGNSIFVRPTDGIPVIVLRFAAPHVSGKPRLDDSATEQKWVTAQDVDAYKPIGSIARDIKRLDAQLAKE